MSGLRIGFFGNFYPHIGRLSSTSVGLVHLLSTSDAVASIEVFAPEGSDFPRAMDRAKISLRRDWRFNDPVSLIRAFLKIRAESPKLDIIIFNLYLTSFGTGNLSNGVGLLLPVLVSFSTRRSPVVYMHNFIETQDIEALGYRPSFLRTLVAKVLERLIMLRCQLVVPLLSQKRTLEQKTHGRIEYGIVPFVEAMPGVLLGGSSIAVSSEPPSGKLRVLLFGLWGPQKDASGILRALTEIHARGLPLEVTITGGINPAFPAYGAYLRSLVSSLGSKAFNLIEEPPEESIRDLFHSSDVIILPYSAAGGYSAVMNQSAFYRLPILAYDVPELRECAEEIGIPCRFFEPGDVAELERSLRTVQSEQLGGSRPTEVDPSSIHQSVKRLERLFGIVPS